MNPHTRKKTGPGLLRRVADTARPAVSLWIDGQAAEALAGDTLLTALLTQGSVLHHSEFSQQARAGFCLMGACQDCWVSLSDGRRLRACATLVENGMQVLTHAPESQP